MQRFVGLQQLDHLLLEDQIGIACLPDVFPLDPRPRGFHKLQRGVHANVGDDQRLLQLLP